MPVTRGRVSFRRAPRITALRVMHRAQDEAGSSGVENGASGARGVGPTPPPPLPLYQPHTPDNRRLTGAPARSDGAPSAATKIWLVDDRRSVESGYHAHRVHTQGAALEADGTPHSRKGGRGFARRTVERTNGRGGGGLPARRRKPCPVLPQQLPWPRDGAAAPKSWQGPRATLQGRRGDPPAPRAHPPTAPGTGNPLTA